MTSVRSSTGGARTAPTCSARRTREARHDHAIRGSPLVRWSSVEGRDHGHAGLAAKAFHYGPTIDATADIAAFTEERSTVDSERASKRTRRVGRLASTLAPDDLVAIGLPNWPRFRRLVADSEGPLRRLGVAVWLVAEGGAVEVRLPMEGSE